MSLAPIDLSRLPLPEAVETLDYEALLEARKDAFRLIAPEFADALQFESDPIVKTMEVDAARELVMRARANDSVRAVMLATSTGGDLDNLVALLGVERQVVVAGNPDAVPPVAAVLESDAALRRRAQMAPEGLTNAGTVGSYTYHALSADARVRDAGVISPAPGDVRITVLSHEDDGVPSADLLANVAARLETVRPLCDNPIIAAPIFVPFTIDAVLHVASAPGASVAVAAAEAAVAAYLSETFLVGRTIRRAALIARLMQVGVENVVLIQPAADIDPGATGAARVTSTTITYEVPV